VSQNKICNAPKFLNSLISHLYRVSLLRYYGKLRILRRDWAHTD